MLHSIVYDPQGQGIIIVKVQGQLTKAIVLDLAQAVAQLAIEKNCLRVLNDLREAEWKLSILDIYTLPKLFSDIASTRDLQINRMKRAVIVSKDEKLPYFFETVSINRGQKVNLFYDDESARQWLLDT